MKIVKGIGLGLTGWALPPVATVMEPTWKGVRLKQPNKVLRPALISLPAAA
jgi:hypothetical protein